MSFFKPYSLSQFDQHGTDLAGICPWAIFRSEGVVQLKNGAFCCAYEFTAPDLGSSAPHKFGAIANSFNHAVIQLGEGWGIQFELQRRLTNKYPGAVFKNLAGFLIERQREINFSYQKAHYENKYYMILTKQWEPEIASKAEGLFFKRSDKNNKFNSSFMSEELKSFEENADRTAAILSGYMFVRRLGSAEMFAFLHSSVSLNWHKMALPEDCSLFLDLAVTDTGLDNSMPMKLGDSYIPIVTVNSFPSNTIPAMFDVINSADCELRWSTRFICYSRETASKRIKDAEKRFHGQRKSIGQNIMETVGHIESSRENATAGAQESESSLARVECDSGNVGFGDYTSSVMVWDEDLDEAEDKARYIAGLISGCSFTCKEETQNALSAFESMMPGNMYANIRRLFVSTGNLSHVIPISSVWSGLRDNVFFHDICGVGVPNIVCSTNYGIPFYLNINTGDVLHQAVLGQTGNGKSTYLALLEAQWLKYPGAQVIIFDKGRSARCLTMCTGGIYIEPGKDAVSFQPLAELDTDEQQRWAAQWIECCLAEQHIKISALVHTAVYNTVKTLATKDKADRTLTSFQQYCEGIYENPETHTNDICDGLAPYVLGGQYGSMFDCRTTNVPSTKWIMYELGSLLKMNAGAVAPALMYLFRLCEKRFDGSPTLLVFDEFWQCLKNDYFAAQFVEWMKTLRKKNVGIIFATQEVTDCINSPAASTIISQCGSKIYLADDTAMTPLVHDAYIKFGLEEPEIELIGDISRSQKKRDYYYKSSKGTRQFQIDLEPKRFGAVQLGILTNSAEDHALLDDVEQKYGKNTGRPLVKEILEAKGIEYKHLLGGRQ